MKFEPIHVARSASLVIFISAAGSVFAVLRESLVAAKLGASAETDAYFFAYTFVVTLPFFMMDAIKKSLAPIYIHGEEAANHSLIGSIMTLHILFYFGLTILVVAIVNLLPDLIASGFNESGQKIVLIMVWMLAPAIVAIGLWGLIRILLEAEGMFFASAVSDSFLSLFVIASVLLAGPIWGVYSLPFGVVLASVAQFLWVGFWLYRKGKRYRLELNFQHPGVKRFFSLFWPPMLAAFLGYGIPIIDRAMASYLSSGTISSLSYAEKIVANVQGIFIIPLNNVLLPSLARQSKGQDRAAFKANIIQTLGMLVFFLTPVSILLSALHIPLIQLLYQRGKFDAAAAAQTASIYQFLVLCLMPMACAVTLETIFSSMEDTRTGSFIGVGTKFASKIFFNLVLISLFGAIGLGLAAPLTYITSGGLLFLILWRRLKGLDGSRLMTTLLKTVAAALLAVLPVAYLANQSGLSIFYQAALLVLAAPVIFLFLSAVFQIPELTMGYRYLVKVKQQLVKRTAVT